MAGAWRTIETGLLLSALVLLTGCTRPSASATPQIQLVPAGDASRFAYVEVSGLSRAERRPLSRPMTIEEWQQVLTVSVKSRQGGTSGIPVAGNYALEGGTIRFTPLFPFDPGREYEVRFGSASATVALPAAPPSAAAHVTQVYPSGDVLPENQLRLYIHFSAPMGRRGGVDRVKLLDDDGREVEMPFLPLDAEFWNGDRTRYTVFFDPGRQKRGILPNREMGPSLIAGRSYTLVVDRNWPDGNGNMLREPFTHRFKAGAPELSPLDPDRWRIVAPRAGTRESLVVIFPKPLDHGLLLTAIGVKRDGQPITGDVLVDRQETRWTMTPGEAWTPGRYELIVLPILEDLAGNRIGRAFEVDGFAPVAAPQQDSRPLSLPFIIPAGTN
jgi:hypothetical protein